MLYAIVALLVIILDQWMKYWVAGNIVMNTGVKEVIPGILSLVNVHNDGAAFSFLSGGNARIYFIAICGVFTLFVIIALATRLIKGEVGRWSAIFVMAGGIGNCIDRILYGYVQDMFKIDLSFAENFPIFNVADVFITLFCIVFIFYILFGGGKKADRKDEDEDEYDDDEDEDFEDEDFEDEDDEEVDDEPVRRRAAKKAKAEPAPAKAEKAEKQPQRKSRQAKYEQDYEQFKAARAARQQEEPAAAPKPAPVVDPADPFAEWERANGAARAAAPKQAEPVKTPAPAPVQPKPAIETPAPASGDEFSLEDILNEFK